MPSLPSNFRASNKSNVQWHAIVFFVLLIGLTENKGLAQSPLPSQTPSNRQDQSLSRGAPSVFRPANSNNAAGVSASNPSGSSSFPSSSDSAEADPWIAKNNYPSLSDASSGGSYPPASPQTNRSTSPSTNLVQTSTFHDTQVQPASFTSEASQKKIPLAASKSTTDLEPKRSSSGGMISSMISMVVSLAFVIAIFMGLAYLLRSAQPAVTKGLPKDVVEVMGRTTLAPRQQMYVIKFGRKLILVSQQLGQTQTLTEIEDPKEVDHLLGLMESASPTSISNSFRNVFHQIAVGKSNVGSWLVIGLIFESYDCERTVPSHRSVFQFFIPLPIERNESRWLRHFVEGRFGHSIR